MYLANSLALRCASIAMGEDVAPATAAAGLLACRTRRRTSRGAQSCAISADGPRASSRTTPSHSCSRTSRYGRQRRRWGRGDRVGGVRSASRASRWRPPRRTSAPSMQLRSSVSRRVCTGPCVLSEITRPPLMSTGVTSIHHMTEPAERNRGGALAQCAGGFGTRRRVQGSPTTLTSFSMPTDAESCACGARVCIRPQARASRVRAACTARCPSSSGAACSSAGNRLSSAA
jgi:hypothetical protein